MPDSLEEYVPPDARLKRAILHREMAYLCQADVVRIEHFGVLGGISLGEGNRVLERG